MPAGGEYHRLRMENVDLPRSQFDGDDPGRGPVDRDQIQHVEFIKKINIILNALLVKGLQDHVPGAIGGIARPGDRFLGDVIGVPAEPALGDETIRSPGERQAHMLHFVDGLNGFEAHELDRILIAQVVASLDGVKGMPFRMIFLLIAERSANPSLRGAGMRPGWIKFT
jgi:hypothetical protein